MMLNQRLIQTTRFDTQSKTPKKENKKENLTKDRKIKLDKMIKR